MPSKKDTKTTKVQTKTVAKPATKKSALNIALFSVDGKKKGNVAVAKEIFGAKVNEALMLQAIRVYLINQRQGTANTKTRGEVRGSTRKIYRQKGTGRARHGAITAPIFVGGGIAMGPRSRNFELKLSKQMRKKALFSALSKKLADEKVMAVDVVSLSGKTKEVAKMFKNMTDFKNNKADKILFIASSATANRASKNMGGVTVVPPQIVNIFDVLNNKYVVFEKEAIAKLENTFLSKKGESEA